MTPDSKVTFLALKAKAEAAEAYIEVMETAIYEAIGADSVQPLLDSYECRSKAVEAYIRTLKP